MSVPGKLDTSLTDDDEEWCCKRNEKRKFVFVHKYRSRYCRKIVSNEDEVVKGIFRDKGKLKPSLRVSFDEKDQILMTQENKDKNVEGKEEIQSENVNQFKDSENLCKPLQTSFNVNRLKQGNRYTLSNLSGQLDNLNQSLSEYDSFEQPTITLSLTKMSSVNTKPLFNEVCHESLNNDDQLSRVLSYFPDDDSRFTPVPRPECGGTENRSCSPECMKLNKRSKRRRSFVRDVAKHCEPDLVSSPSESDNILVQTQTIRNSVALSPFFAVQCCSSLKRNLPENSSLQNRTQKDADLDLDSSCSSIFGKAINSNLGTSSDSSLVESDCDEKEKEDGFLCALFDPV